MKGKKRSRDILVKDLWKKSHIIFNPHPNSPATKGDLPFLEGVWQYLTLSISRALAVSCLRFLQGSSPVAEASARAESLFRVSAILAGFRMMQ